MKTGLITGKEKIADDIYSMWIKEASMAAESKPGQFISIYCKDGSRLLPRPISICEIDKEGGLLRIVFRIAGEGTKEIASFSVSEEIKVLGPLGNGFITDIMSNDTNSLNPKYGGIEVSQLITFDYNIDYVVIDNHERLLAATRRDLNEKLNDAIRNRDTIVDVLVNNEIVGKVIFYNDIARSWEQYKTKLVNGIICIFVILLSICVGYVFYLNQNLLRPFNKLKDFAQRIAVGNLDVPLNMDKNNIFGAFTESFDLMREELHKARENERKANRSKKELVASLSHDIKTPIASIKAVTDLMLVTVKDEKEKKQLEKIVIKAEQINSLITNMFHATLEELQALCVTVTEIHSTAIPNMIQNADYEERVKMFEIPSCIVLADLLRLQQIFDNLISNSYKYAGTDIEIHAVFNEKFLIIDIMDFGSGVAEEELPLLLGKFYRGKNSGEKSGYGLGLYISAYLMEQMSGELQCKNRPDGFTVRLMLYLA